MCNVKVIHRFALTVLLLLALSPAAMADRPPPPAYITGDIQATPESSRPDLGAWEYILTMSWEMASTLRLGHFSLYLDDAARGCSCDQLQAGVTPGDTVGFSHSAKSLSLFYYYSEFACDGDPDLPIMGKMLVFRPFLPDKCLPGPVGDGTFRLFSDFPPAAIQASGLYLVDGDNHFVGSGSLSGDFPALPCDPVSARPLTWGAMKSVYSR